MEYIKKIDEMGGMPVAIEKGYIQQEIHNSAYLIQQRIEKSIENVIGVNIFCTDEESKIKTFEYDEDAESKITNSLKLLKEIRDEKLDI
ncbi:unnamed protein product [marine sediment metagenome]|uniref:Methylmalonyl-CoA mutase alpha/beta chain catalytic domain-containing protein n=1 Tax=marine sediment metagenome TaxID=412755 RepID=X1B099_9ZZZZ